MAISMIDGLAARLTGPMNFRFILQPVLAILMGIRDGRHDSKAGTPPFLFEVFTDPAHRKRNLVGALKSLLVPIAIGTVLDGVAQYLIFRDVPGRTLVVHPLAALVVGTTVIGIPYALARSLTNRLLRSRRSPPA
ncbi:MAG TPA: hypothetical protein VMJ70_11215 [Candidatus Sulfotelmatobacter sp.]|nr:hypothetical protein [Candidatus Sulfotelmatobacter sp.]